MKRGLSWFLSILMVVSCIPTNAFQAYAAESEGGYQFYEEMIATNEDFPDGEELLDGYAYQLLYGNVATYRRKLGDTLTGNEKVLYDALVPILKQIASGERTSTVIGVGETIETAQGLYQADVAASFEGTELNVHLVFFALLADLPYELYWFDKTTGLHTTYTDDGSVINHVQTSFSVSENYRGSEEFSVDCKRARAAAAAAKNSAAIVSAYANDTDYEKLLGYKEEICYLTDYEFSGSYTADNDPWQLIHVFDGDDETKVVCEGYSKAFAYLCEQTAFAGDVSCITVTGYMSGDHMWNIVTLEGKNYLVDVTNSEGGTVGGDGSLFLAGGVGSVAEGFAVGDCFYMYDTDEPNGEVALWGDGPDSVLHLASENYVPAAVETVASGSCNESIQWSLSANGTLTITGTGEMPNYALYGAPWYEKYSDSIQKVNIEYGIRKIGDYAFAALPNLTRVFFSDSVVNIEIGAFQDCPSLKTVSLPMSLWSIGDYAFAGCTALEKVNLPEYTAFLYDFAFYGCTALQKVEISFQVYTIGASAFDKCDSLKEIRVDTDNTHYSSDATGALYDKNKTLLLKVPGSAPFGHYVIADSVTTVGASAFSDCSDMTAVTIPAGVTAIKENAFSGCKALTDVYYIGTVEQWQQITISQGNAPLSDGDLHSVICQNHQSVQHPAQAPSCTEPGWIAYEKCANCGHGNYREIPATGHTLYPYSGKEPTCTEPGWKAYGICEYCDYSTYEAISATGHSFVNYEAKDPTCTEYGWNAYGICGVCGHSTYEEIPAFGHSYKDMICTTCGREAAIVANGSCGSQVSWELRECGTMILSGSGDMADYYGLYATPWSAYAEDIKTVLIREGVTSVGTSAFSTCDALKTINFAGTVARIGDDAFSHCDALTAVVIGDGVTEIGYDCFKYCSNLETVTIGSGVTVIRDTAFWDCAKLLGYRVSGDNETYSSDESGVLFNKNKTILLRFPCGKAGSYEIPSGVVSIDSRAFAGCAGLTGVTVPESLASLHKTVFDDCSNLAYNFYCDAAYLGTTDNPYHILMKPAVDAVTELKIYSDTEKIADEAFYDHESLLCVTIPGSVSYIGANAFGSCSGLASLTIESGVQEIGRFAFSNCSALTALSIPDSVTTVGNQAFSACTGLTEVTFGKGVRTIGEFAFNLCTGLNSIVIGENVTTIGRYAFFYCTALTSVTIPAGVTMLGGSVFNSCDNLQDIYYCGTEQQWSQINIQADHSWKNNVTLHYNAGHTHNFENLICTVCGCKAADLTIESVTLRPGSAGMYFSGSFDIQEGVAVVRKGIAVSVYNALPVADGSDPDSLWSEGTTSVLVYNILNEGLDDTSNGGRAAMPVYARAYVELADGTYCYSDVVAMNLQQVVEAADARWETLDDVQRSAITAMYAQYQSVLQDWNIPNLKEN